MIPKATEDTITSILAEELRKHEVINEPFARITTPVGDRTPDLVCKNAGSYLIEAKFSEGELLQAISKIENDYLKHHKVLGIHGGFAVLHPKELAKPLPIEVVRELAQKLKFRLIAMFPTGDPRPFRDDEGKIDEIAIKLSEYILIPTKPVEPSIEFTIKSLRESAMCLLNGLKYLAGSDLESFFGGRGVFEHVLQYKEREYPVEELRSATAYILVNQLLFYHVISRFRPEFEEIDSDKIQRPSDLSEYFSNVLHVNYKPIFFYDVASKIPGKFLNEVKTVINVIKGLSIEKVGGDLLGTIFHDLVPFETRKDIAAFYTNPLAAELLASLSIEDPSTQVADLAVGSGGLLVAAYRRKKELLKESFTERIHRRFVGYDLLGVDVMPFAASVAACHLALQCPQYLTDRAKVAIWDSTELEPGRKIPSAAGLKTVIKGQTYLESFLPPIRKVKGTVEVGEGETLDIWLNPHDVVIMNPPFTRYQRIPTAYKKILEERFSDYKRYIRGQMGYHCYFILLADVFLKVGGNLALVLPATFLRVKSAEGVREFLIKNYEIKHIITMWERAAFSEGAQFREILLVGTKKDEVSDLYGKCVVTVLKRLPRDPKSARSLALEIRKMAEREIGDVYETDDIISRVFSQGILKDNVSNLFSLIAFGDFRLLDVWEEIVSHGRIS